MVKNGLAARTPLGSLQHSHRLISGLRGRGGKGKGKGGREEDPPVKEVLFSLVLDLWGV